MATNEFAHLDLQSRRNSLRLSQAQLAERLGVSANTVARWERGELVIAHPRMLDMALRKIEEEAARLGDAWDPQAEEDRAIEARIEQHGTLSQPQLVALIREHGVQAIADAISNPGTMLERGWNLLFWRFQQVPGAVIFFQVRQTRTEYTAKGPKPVYEPTEEPGILVVNAPESDRAKWEHLVSDAGAPVVLCAPGGRVAR